MASSDLRKFGDAVEAELDAASINSSEAKTLSNLLTMSIVRLPVVHEFHGRELTGPAFDGSQTTLRRYHSIVASEGWRIRYQIAGG
jgi:hypothetical protein